MGLVLSSGMASMQELSTTISLRVMFNLVEIIQVNRYNTWVAANSKEG